jgi:hypothetical protein
MELDALLPGPTELHCLGGFVILEMYGLQRITADVDVLKATGTDSGELICIAGQGSALHKRYKVYLDVVTVASVPENYEDRLIDLLPETFEKLRLRGFERHDLVLAKLARNIDRDREDVRTIAARPGLDPVLLRARYQAELRFKLGRPEREDLTLDLWIEIIEEVQSRKTDRPSSPLGKS